MSHRREGHSTGPSTGSGAIVGAVDVPDEQTSTTGPILSAIRSHPVIAGILLGCTVLGAVLGVALLTGEWSLVRRIAGGAVAGAGVGLIITASRMLG